MEIKYQLIISCIFASFITVLNFFFFFNPLTRWFKPMVVLAILIALSPYFISFLRENKRQKEIESQFLEFVRSIFGTVKSGISVPKAIIQGASLDYGALSPYLKKLAHQIEWGFSTQEALEAFANETNNLVIKRSIAIVIEAEKAGGNMEEVLQAVTNSIIEIKKIKDERKSAIHSQIVQGYIVFFIFIIIMLVLQLKLLPPLVSLTGVTLGGLGEGFDLSPGPKGNSLEGIQDIFLYLIVIQGFFIGLAVGKFSEGSIKYGLKHSFAMAVIGYLILSVALGI